MSTRPPQNTIVGNIHENLVTSQLAYSSSSKTPPIVSRSSLCLVLTFEAVQEI